MTTEAKVLKAELRDKKGTRGAQRVRKQGQVPAIIYGHGEAPQSVQLSAHELAMELQRHHRVLTIELSGKQQQVLIKELQYDYVRGHVLHLDLTRVNLDERVEVSVSIEFRGTPAGAEMGGMVEHVLNEVDLECPVVSIPESVRAVMTPLNVGDVLTAGDLVLPEGTRLLTDPETVIATVTLPTEEEEAEELAPEGAAEPEVIRREEAEAGQD